MNEETKRCPFCAEEIKGEAVKCRYCGEFFDGRVAEPSAGTEPEFGKDLRSFSPGQQFGAVVMFLGILGAVYFFAIFDTSVEVPVTQGIGQSVGGGRVNNLGLMNQRQNGIIISCVAAIIGLILMVVGRIVPRRVRNLTPTGRVPGGLVCPNCGLISPETAERCDCGFRFRSEARREV